MNPKISVIITAHNYAKYLPSAIDSVLRQTYQNFEIIVVNDGSTDHTEEVLKAYENMEKVGVMHLSGGGLVKAANVGIRSSKGDYVVRLDADDYFDENILLVECQILDNHPEIGMVYPDYYRVNKYGEIIDIVRQQKVNDEVKLLDRSPLAAGAMYRRKCFDELTGYNEELRYQEDYDFWVRFIDKYNVYNVNLPLLYYRQHSRSMSMNTEGRTQARRYVKQKIIDSKGLSRQNGALCILPVIAENRFKHKFSLHEIQGKPLMAYSIEEALKIKEIDRVIVSTEDEEIAEAAKKYGAEVPFIRPRSLAKLTTETEDIIAHTLFTLKKYDNYNANIVIELYYNNPLMKSYHIKEAMNTLLIHDADSVISVCEDLTFHWQPDIHGLKPVVYKKRLLRENKKLTYKEAGGIYVMKAINLHQRTRNRLGKKISFIELQPYEIIKVEDELSLWMFEQMVRQKWTPST